MSWGMGWMWVFWLIVLIAVVGAALALARRSGGPRTPVEEDRAEAVLRERYARGEIDEATYRRMRDQLRGG